MKKIILINFFFKDTFRGKTKKRLTFLIFWRGEEGGGFNEIGND